ncbi:MAG: T9SS type A sorting domain-containing protein [Chitinophagaceae bacterium]
MKTFNLSLLLLCTFIGARAQNFNWVKPYIPNGQFDYSYSWITKTDATGNVYNVGFLSGTVDFDPGPAVFNLSNNNSNGTLDMYVTKKDINGNLVWAKLINGYGNASPTPEGFDIDNNGNLIIVGYFDAMVDFDPSPAVQNNITPAGILDAFILKLNANGNLVWVKTISANSVVGFSYVNATAVTFDANNDILFSGSFIESLDCDPGPNQTILTASLNSFDGYLVKLLANGNFAWAKQYVSTSGEVEINSLDVDGNGNIIVGGRYSGDIDLDPGVSQTIVTKFDNDIFYSKLNNTGTFLFGGSFGSIDADELVACRFDNANNIVFVGNYYENIDVDPSNASFILTANSPGSGSDIYISKLSPTGSFLWGKKIGGTDDDYALDMDIDATGNIYSTGYFTSSDFNPGNNILTSTQGNEDIFISSIKANGTFSSANYLGNSQSDVATTIHCGANNSLYITGVFMGTVDFDPSSTIQNLTALSSNIGDNFTLRWSLCNPSNTNINASGCSYSLNGINYTSSGIYYQYFTNSTGCDSIITINLTNSGSNTILSPQVCNSTSYTLNGQTYTSSGTYVQNYTGANGCDSLLTIQLSIGQASNSFLTEQACDQYVFNNNFLFSSGIYTDTLINSTGCDSIITLNLTIHNSSYTTLQVNTCGPYQFGGTTYTQSGIYSHFFTSVNGCDSIIDLDLTINPIPVTTVPISSCTSPVIYNGQSYSSSGTYSQIFTNAQGCDSTVLVVVTINSPNNQITQNANVLTSNANAPTTYQWITCNPITLIAGANQKTYTATVNGQYAVIVSLNGCSDTSACKTVIGIGVDNYVESNLVQVYPNPTQHSIQIKQIGNTETIKLTLTDVLGKVVLSETIEQSVSTVSLNHLATGNYYLHLRSSQKNQTIKVIKD